MEVIQGVLISTDGDNIRSTDIHRWRYVVQEALISADRDNIRSTDIHKWR